MTRREEIDAEIRRQSHRLIGKCNALFELPRHVYAQILDDNTLRKQPYRVSFERVQKVIREISEELSEVEMEM